VLVVKHASDATSIAVRAGAVNAIAHILATPSSHAILRELLPPLGNLIHDKAEKVRLAVVKLLQRIKKVPNIKYYKVVSVHHLMARLVAEQPKKANNNSVIAGLTELMVNSYAPENADVEQLVGRTQKFLADYPRAAPTFYSHLKKFRSSSFICQLVVGLYHCLCYELKSNQKTAEKRRSQSGKRCRTEDQTTDKDDNNNADVNLVLCCTLVNVMLVLWTSIKADLDQSVEWSDFVASEIEGQSLIDMVSWFDHMSTISSPNEDDDGDEAHWKDICNHSSRLLLQCAALLPHSAAESLMKELPSNSGTSKSPAYYALMSVWGFGIGDELASSIAAAFGDDPMIVPVPAGDNLPSIRRGLGGASESLALKTDPLRAVRIVSAILKADDPSSNTARDSLVNCDPLFNTLQKASVYALHVISGDVVSVRLSRETMVNLHFVTAVVAG
jgi:condensin-2 complex subunit G2